MWIGCDIVKMSRIKNLDALAKRILSQSEFDLFESYPEHRQREFLAGRFAAREAIIKALPISLGLKDIVIMPKQDIEYKGYTIRVSISHDGNYAMAMALVLKGGA